MRTRSSPHPPIFVLLHGACHGGWCWKRVASLLRAAGHDAHTPTLTGLGDRVHLSRPDLGLTTHARDLEALFVFEDLDDVVLVAHSYGGMVASAAMEHVADRVRLVIFLDAVVPRAGECMLDLVADEVATRIRRQTSEQGHGVYLPVRDASTYGIIDPDDIAWVNSRLTQQPLRTLTEPIGTVERAAHHPGAFIECCPSTVRPDIRARARARSLSDDHFDYRVLEAAHDIMVASPDRLTALLVELAGQAQPIERGI